MNISFKLEDIKNKSGIPVPTVVKYEEGKPSEEWVNVEDLDTLFDTCVDRWGNNWDLNKIMTAIRETEVD